MFAVLGLCQPDNMGYISKAGQLWGEFFREMEMYHTFHQRSEQYRVLSSISSGHTGILVISSIKDKERLKIDLKWWWCPPADGKYYFLAPDFEEKGKMQL